jgi:hypothetical protein
MASAEGKIKAMFNSFSISMYAPSPPEDFVGGFDSGMAR